VKKDLHLAVAKPRKARSARPADVRHELGGRPSAIQIGSEYYVYFDHYGNPSITEP